MERDKKNGPHGGRTVILCKSGWTCRVSLSRDLSGPAAAAAAVRRFGHTRSRGSTNLVAVGSRRRRAAGASTTTGGGGGGGGLKLKIRRRERAPCAAASECATPVEAVAEFDLDGAEVTILQPRSCRGSPCDAGNRLIGECAAGRHKA